MSRLNLFKIPAGIAICAALLAAQQTARAVPITGKYVDDPRCDTIPNQTLTHEIGDAATFPLNEGIVVVPTSMPNFTVCVPPDSIPQNDWVVDITNISGQAWKNLFFVCDHNVTVGNADGTMEDSVGAPGAFTDSFRIDGTVTLGLNNNLLSETGGTTNEIFEPGETWRFAVSNYMAVTAAGFQPPIMITPGIFAGSTNFPQTAGNCSILAQPVPEPATVTVIGLSAAALLMRRPKRKMD